MGPADWRRPSIPQDLPDRRDGQNLRDDVKRACCFDDAPFVDVPARGGPGWLVARLGAGAGPTWPREIPERSVMKKLLTKLLKDEQGGEVLEYALIAGLIVVAAIAVIGTVGTKVLARWTSVSNGLDTQP
jgi:pilus assembly protein Flp/PilA